MSWKKCVLFAVSVLASVYLSGCGGSSKPVSVAVTASAATVDGLNSVTLTATVTNDKNTDGVAWTVSGGGTLSNTSSTSATYTAPAVPASALTATVTATSVADTSKVGSVNLTVPGKLTITSTGGTTGTLAGTVGAVYSVQLTSSAGIPPYAWSLAAGSTLPACLTMTPAGLITSNGPLMASCAVDPNLTFDVSDSGNPPMTASEQLDLIINPATPVVFSGTSVPPATATFGTLYTGAVSASGGVGTLSYSASGLPAWLSFNATTLALSGTPSAVGKFTFTIKASDAYGDATSQSYTVTVSPESSTLAFAAIPAETYGNAPFTVSATSASSGAVTYSVTSGPATINSTTGLVTLTGVGTVVLGASQAATANYAAATATASFTVNPEAPTLTFETIPAQTYGNAPFTVSATSASSGAVTYSVTSGPATINSTTGSVTLTGAGTVVLSASQAANGNYAAATATATFTVYAEAPKLTFAAIPSETFGTAPFTVSATSASSGAVTYSVTSGPATINSSTGLVTLTGAGTVVLGASQAAGGNYGPATATVSFTVNPATPTLAFAAIPTQTYGIAPFTVSATSASSGAVTYSVTSGPATINSTTGQVTLTGVGTVVLGASQAATTNYIAATASTSFTVKPEVPALTFAAIPAKTYGIAPFIVSATSASSGAVTYSVTSGPATINSTTGQVTLTGVGTVVLGASQAANGNYAAATATVSFTVNPEGITLTFAAIPTETFGNAPFTVSASSVSSGAVTYSVTSGPATINSTTGLVTLTGAGTVVLGANQAASGDYAAATATASFTVGQETPTLTFATIPSEAYGNAPFTVSATSASTGAVTYTVTSGPATINSTTGQVTLTGVGTVDLSASQAATTNYTTATATASFTVSQGTPKLVFAAIPVETYGNAPFTVSATSASTGAVTYSVTSGPATINSTTGQVTLTGVGTVALSASQAATANYTAATATASFTVNPEVPTLIFAAIPTETYGNPPFTVSASSQSSGAVTYSVTSGPATINSTTGQVTLTGAGTVVLGASQAASGNYAAATATTSFTVNAEAPTLVFAAIPTETYGNAPFTVSATSASSGAVTYTVTSGPATINSTTGLVTLTGAGTVKLSASQAATTNYSAATATISFTVGQGTPTLTFATIPTETYGNAPFTVSATSASSGAVTYSVTSGPATINSTTGLVMLTGAGTVDLSASQAATTNYAAATATASFTVNPEVPTLTFATIPTETYGNAPFMVSASSQSSGAVTYSVTSGPATINSTTGQVTLTGVGTVKLGASQAASGNYAAATATASFTVNPETPTLVFASIPTHVYGDAAFTASATSASSGAVTYSVTSGPATINSTTGLVTLTGSGAVMLGASQTASGNYAAATASISFTVNPALSITTPSPLPTGVVGTAYSQQLAASGGIGPYTWTLISPSSALANLGLTFNTGNGTLAGSTPIAGGPVVFTVQVNDSASHQVQATFSVTINASLNITTTSSSFPVTYTGPGVSFQQMLTATGGAGTPYTWSTNTAGTASLKAVGLTLSSNGTISNGTTALAAGTATFTVQVMDSKGATATQLLTIYIYNPVTLPAAGALTGATINQPYSVNVVASGGNGSYTWTVTGLPADSLTYSTNGATLTISGLPTQTQVVTVKASVKDSNNSTAGPIQYTIAVNPPSPLALPASGALAGATTNDAYNGTIVATGGSGSGYVFTVNVGSTPTAVPNNGTQVTVADGIWVSNNNNSTLTIGGTPTLTQTVTLTVSVKDGAGDSAGANAYTIAVNPPAPLALPSFNPLPGATTNNAYNGSITASGGSGFGYVFTVNVGSTPTAVPTNGTQLTVADSIWVSNDGSSTLTIGGTPALSQVVTLTLSVKDGAGDKAGAKAYTIAVNPPTPLTLPGAGSLGGATTNVSYGGAINANGGSGSGYVFTVNVGSTPTAVPTNGTPLTVADGITVSNTGGNTLAIGGTPTLTEVVTLTVSVKDGAGDGAGPNSYTIAVNPPSPLTLPGNNPNPLSLPNPTLNQGYSGAINASGGSGQGYSFTVSGTLVTNVNGTPVTLPNTNGLTATNNGGSTLSIGGTPTSAASITLNVTVTDSANDTASQSYTINVINPNAGYTVSGTIHYSGSQTGWIYIRLNDSGCNGGCGNSSLGTAISAPGSYTIHGVPPGSYTVQAYMDVIGYGGQNASDPTGVSGTTTTVTSSGATGADDTLFDPGTVAFSSAPKWDPSQGLGVFSGGAMIYYDPINNSNGIEMPTSYALAYSTDSTFKTGVTTKTFPATGGTNPWIVTGLTNTDTYYFRAAGVVGSGTSAITGSWSAAAPTGGLTIGAPTGGYAISGKVTFAGTATGPLYVGFYNQSTGQIYATQVGTESNPPASPASYSINVPAGSYYLFGTLDQGNQGLMSAPGTISNTNQQSSASVAITGSTTTENLDLTPDSASGIAMVKTNHSEQITAVGINNNYGINFQVYGLYKLPVAVELVTGSNQDVVMPTDVVTGAFNGNNDEFSFGPSLNGAVPKVGDTYTLNVTYSDGSSNSTANSPANPLVVTIGAVLNAFASSPTPASQATGVSLTPNFSWTDPASAGNYVYAFQLQDSNNNTVWRIPAQHSNTNGFASTITTIDWDADPTGSGTLPSVTQLNGSSTYWWSIQAADSDDNEAQIQWEFETVETVLSLPASGALGAGEVNSNYNGSIVASGGSGSGYNFTVVVGGTITLVPNNNSQLQVADGIWVSSNGGNTLTIGGYTGGTPQTVTLAIAVTDSANNQANGSYTIAIGSAQIGFTISGKVTYSGSQSGWVYVSLPTCTGCTPNYGTTISPAALASGGAFTIRGVPPGNYVVQAWMDTLGYGSPNAADPSTNPLPTVTVTVDNSPMSGISAELADPPPVNLSAAPTWSGQVSGAFSGGAFISFNSIRNNNNNVEIPSSYVLEYSTDSTFATGVSSKTFPATGGNNAGLAGSGGFQGQGGNSPWIVTGLTNNETYYFRAAGVVGSGGFATQGPWSAASPGILIGAPSGGNAVAGKVTFSAPAGGSITGPLYVGFWNQNTGKIYAEEITSPASPQNYSVSVPSGSNYFFFAVIDQNNDGVFDPGDITNAFNYNMITPSVDVAGALANENLTLSSSNSLAAIITENSAYSEYSGSGQSFALDLIVATGNKLPVSAALLSGSNVLAPMDIALCQGCGYDPNGRFWAQNLQLNSALAPTVGNLYSVQVAYSDGTSETLSPKITNVLPNDASNLSPSGPLVSTGTSPTFSWIYPASDASSYFYQLFLFDLSLGYNQVWSIPNVYTASNSFTDSVTPSIAWGVDPTDPNNPPAVSSLTDGNIYYFQMTAYDTFGNRGNYTTTFVPRYTAFALPAANPSSLGSATLGQLYSGSIAATGGYLGYCGYSYSVNNANDWGWSNVSLGNGLTANNNCGVAPLTITGTPTATGAVTFTVYAKDASGTTVGPIQYTINVSEQAISLPSSATGSALVGYAYSQSLNASGGSGSGYVFTVALDGGAASSVPASPSVLPLTDGLSVTSSGNTLTVSGTPTSPATISLAVSVKDSQTNSTSQNYTIDAIAGPNGANNKYLSGTYACKFDGFNDSDGSRWTSVSSFKANGAAGTISSGVWDTNGHDFSSAISGTSTGSYSIGADNNGLMTIASIVTSGGSGTHNGQYAIALNDTGSSTTATEFHAVEIDDVGSNPSGMTGAGDCYQATTSTFGTDVFTGNSFVFGMTGDNGNGDPSALLGRFVTSSGSVTEGVVDQAKVTDSSITNTTFTSGSYTTPDATNGRSTLTFAVSGGSVSFKVYVIDANRMFMIQITDQKAQSGDMRKQLNTSSYTAANITGPMVDYAQGYEYSNGSPSGFDSSVSQMTGNGAGVLTINQGYSDENGTYQAGKENGGTITVNFDSSNPGRATLTGSFPDTIIMYSFNTGSAFTLDFDTKNKNGETLGYLETGWMEPQSQTTFTNAALTGDYLFGQLPVMQAVQDGAVGELDVLSNGTITGGLTEADEGNFTWDQAPSWTYSWDTSTTGTGTFLVAGTGDTGGDSCAVISSTRVVCTPNADSWPSVAILQQ